MAPDNPYTPIVPSGFSIYDNKKDSSVIVLIHGVLQDDSPEQIVLPLTFPNRQSAKVFLQKIVDDL